MRKISDETIAEIIDMYEKGFDLCTIAIDTGVSQGTIGKYVKAAGLSRSRGGELSRRIDFPTNLPSKKEEEEKEAALIVSGKTITALGVGTSAIYVIDIKAKTVTIEMDKSSITIAINKLSDFVTELGRISEQNLILGPEAM